MFDKAAWIDMLNQKLPGEEAQLEMSPTFRGRVSWDKKPVDAAVMALLYPANGRLHLAFIKRNAYDGPHSAQISFPGGAREKGDPTLKHTAIRETREELGINHKMEVLGSLTPLYIPVSNFMVYPFVGCLHEAPVFDPDPSEVQYVVEASLETLLDPMSRDCETLFHHDTHIEAPFYRVGKEKIWGATAMILSELLQLATSLQ